SPRRVAARAHVLAAVVCRAGYESEPGAEAWRRKLLEWIEALGLGSELEPSERTFLHTRLRQADPQVVINGWWRKEGLCVLAWALRRFDLPPYDEQVLDVQPAASLDFTKDSVDATDTAAAADLLQSAHLRPAAEIGAFSGHITLVSWRLRHFSFD